MAATVWPASAVGSTSRSEYILAVTRRPSLLDDLLDRAGAAGHHDGPGPDELLDPERPNDADDGDDLGLRAADLDDHGVGPEVEDPAAAQLDHDQQIGPVRLRHADLHERELVLDEWLARDVLDLYDIDEPVQLLRSLLDRDVVAVQADRHPRQARLVGPADAEPIDVA